MRQRFGAPLFDGCGGENILVKTAGPITMPHLAGGLVIRPAGRTGVVALRVLRTAPAVPRV